MDFSGMEDFLEPVFHNDLLMTLLKAKGMSLPPETATSIL